MTDKNYTIHFGVASVSDVATLPDGCFTDGDAWEAWGSPASTDEAIHVQWNVTKDEAYRSVGVLMMMHWRTIYKRQGYVGSAITVSNRWEWGEQSHDGCFTVNTATRPQDEYVQNLNAMHANDPD